MKFWQYKGGRTGERIIVAASDRPRALVELGNPQVHKFERYWRRIDSPAENIRKNIWTGLWRVVGRSVECSQLTPVMRMELGLQRDTIERPTIQPTVDRVQFGGCEYAAYQSDLFSSTLVFAEV